MSNVDRHKAILDEVHKSYEAKNHDYGDSFAVMFQKFGLLSSVIRLSDKLGRLETLTKAEAKVKDESIRDTLLDMANYAVMTVMEMDADGDVCLYECDGCGHQWKGVASRYCPLCDDDSRFKRIED